MKKVRSVAAMFFLLSLPTLASAQCYTAYRDAGKALVKDKKYDEAIQKFEKAKNCQSDKPANGDVEINALIADVKKWRTSKSKSNPIKPNSSAPNSNKAKSMPKITTTESGEKTPSAKTTSPAIDPTRCADCPEMILVTGGRFTMGCKDSKRDGDCYVLETPPHEVTLRDFYIGKYEVTQAEWRQVMDNDPPELYNKGCDQCPVERVSWNDIQDFIKKLNAQTGKKYRLPTEAEWEYAARGGNQSKGYLYSGSNTIGEVAWYADNASSKTKPVGGKKANELGIHDMSGNVWECVEDDWHDDFKGVPTDGRAWVDSAFRSDDRVFRGGSWFSAAQISRAASRFHVAPEYCGYSFGFRLALQL